MNLTDEFRGAISVKSARTAYETVRDWVLTVAMVPFFFPGWIVGFVLSLLKLCLGAVVTGFKYGFRSLGSNE